LHAQHVRAVEPRAPPVDVDADVVGPARARAVAHGQPVAAAGSALRAREQGAALGDAARAAGVDREVRIAEARLDGDPHTAVGRHGDAVDVVGILVGVDLPREGAGRPAAEDRRVRPAAGAPVDPFDVVVGLARGVRRRRALAREKYEARWSGPTAATVSTCGSDAGNSSGLPLANSLPAAATTVTPAAIACWIARYSAKHSDGEP